MHCTDGYSQHVWIIWSVCLDGWKFVYKLSGCGFECCCSHLNADILSVLSKEFGDIQATIEFGFSLKCICDMIKTDSQLHCTEKFLQHSAII